MSSYERLGIAASVVAGALKLVYNASTGVYEYVKQVKADEAARDVQSAENLDKVLASMNKEYQDANKPPVNPVVVPAVALGIAALIALS